MPKLSELLPKKHILSSDPEIRMLTADSRQVKEGCLFAALPGNQMDGRVFITTAINNGAIAILAPKGTVINDDRAVLITDENPRQCLAQMASAFYPDRPRFLAAVTGTNGKTSVACFTRQIWATLGYPAASLGTIGLASPTRSEKSSMTTPDPIIFHKILEGLSDDSVSHCVFEASSHGLDQSRLDGVKVLAAAFTNLTRDHLDYHGDMERYWQAKSLLFTRILAPWGTVVFNSDSPYAKEIIELPGAKKKHFISYGITGSHIQILETIPTSQGQKVNLRVFRKNYSVYLPLIGTFQLANALCALGLALGTGAVAEQAIAALEKLEGVPGRLQLAAIKGNNAPIYVDYAHTPDALQTILQALRPHVRGKLLLLFGCGGDRDTGKRPMMGEVARKYADKIWITDDNPRSENPENIRWQIRQSCPNAVEIGDRRSAIRAAIADLEEEDLLILAGKGHESGQITGNKILPFDDAEEALLAVQESSR